MVLQKLIQDGHLEVRESLIDMNNTVLKVRLESKKRKIVKYNTKGSLIISSTGAMCTGSQRFDPNYQTILQYFQGSLTSNAGLSLSFEAGVPY